MNESITTLRLEDVYPNPRHYRDVTPEAVRALADSIEVVGQIEPISVYRDGEIYIIDSGHHRHAALKLLGIETVKAVVIEDSDESASAKIMVAANLHFPESELERSRGTQLMLSTGVRPVDAAALIGERNTDKMEKVSRGLAIAKDYAEDMTLDRIAAVSEFEGDSEAVESLLTCYEREWPSVYANLTRARKLKDAVATCEKIIAESGVELLTAYPDDMRYIGESMQVPDGAIAGRIRSNEWSGTASVMWYGEATAQDDAAENAKRAERDQRNADIEASRDMRIEFVAAYLEGKVSGLSNALRDFATIAWEDGYPADSEDILSTLAEVTGFMPRIYAAILTQVDRGTQYSYGSDYWRGHHAKTVTAYFAALTECGYELSPIESELLAQIEAEGDGDE